jgi:uncharacterized protein
MSADLPRVSRLGFELESYTFALLLTGERYDEVDRDTFEELNTAHIEYTMSLRAGGQLLAAGALRTDDTETPVHGLGFYRVSPEEAQRLSDQDPAIKAGIYRVETFTFLGPKGGLAFPLAAE